MLYTVDDLLSSYQNYCLESIMNIHLNRSHLAICLYNLAIALPMLFAYATYVKYRYVIVIYRFYVVGGMYMQMHNRIHTCMSTLGLDCSADNTQTQLGCTIEKYKLSHCI